MGEALFQIQIAPSTTPTIAERLVDRRWYAVYTRPSHEAQVLRHFSVRGIEGYLPQYEVVHRWKNRCTKILKLPFFPGYLFAHIAATERVRVLGVPGVLLLVGAGGKPTPLPDDDIETLQAGLHLRKAEPFPFLEIGERARIRSGALSGLEGVIVRDKNKLRVVISLDLIRQSVAVEVDWNELEPVGPRRPRPR